MHGNYRNLRWYGIAAHVSEIALLFFLDLFTPLDFSVVAYIAVMSLAVFPCFLLPAPVNTVFRLPKLKRSGVSVDAEVLSAKIEGDNQNDKRDRMHISTIRFELDGRAFIKKLYNLTIFRYWTRVGEKFKVFVDPSDTDNFLVIPKGRVFIIVCTIFGILLQAVVIVITASACIYNK